MVGTMEGCYVLHGGKKCRPSKYNHEECNSWNWFWHTQKQSDTGTLKLERVALFQKLLELGEKYWRVNQ